MPAQKLLVSGGNRLCTTPVWGTSWKACSMSHPAGMGSGGRGRAAWLHRGVPEGSARGACGEIPRGWPPSRDRKRHGICQAGGISGLIACNKDNLCRSPISPNDPCAGCLRKRYFKIAPTLAVSNRFFDPDKAADDYNYYLDEACYCEELGFDGVALNEHHGNPFCMGNVMNVEAAILARITSRIKIILIGNPLPVIKHPLRMAEELATIDLISRGRLITGWVRGAGSEQFFNNANPAYNREIQRSARLHRAGMDTAWPLAL